MAVLLLLAVAACGSMNAKRNPRDAMLYQYVSAVRWSDFDRAVGFLDPKVLEAEPLDPLELERLKQYQVSGYEVRTSSEPAEHEYEQVVEIRLVNRHTQADEDDRDDRLGGEELLQAFHGKRGGSGGGGGIMAAPRPGA